MKIFVAVIVLFLIALAVTNPSKEAYLEHLVWKMRLTTCKQNNLPINVQASCAAFGSLPQGVTKGMLSGYVRREDYLVFSIYTLDFFSLEDRSLGVGNFFL